MLGVFEEHRGGWCGWRELASRDTGESGRAGLSYSLAKGGNPGPRERQGWPKVPH